MLHCAMVANLGYQIRLPVAIQNLMLFEEFQIATTAAILDIWTERFSNPKSPCHPHAFQPVSAQSDLRFGRRCGFKNFKMAAMAAILDIGAAGF